MLFCYFLFLFWLRPLVLVVTASHTACFVRHDALLFLAFVFDCCLPSCCGVCFGCPTQVVRLLAKDARIDVGRVTRGHKTTAFYLACYRGHLEVVKVLAPLVDVMQANSNGASPFYIACQRGRASVVECVLLHTFVSSRGVPLHAASLACCEAHGQLLTQMRGCVRYLCALVGGHRYLLTLPDVKVNTANNAGISPFFTACENGQLKVVRLLVEKAAVDVGQRDRDGFTPFSVACWRGHAGVVRWGLLCGARVVCGCLRWLFAVVVVCGGGVCCLVRSPSLRVTCRRDTCCGAFGHGCW